MHIKFVPRGKGSGKNATDYLLGAKDSKGEIRADVQVLRGDPAQIGQLIDCLQLVNRYRSAVVAFHKDDAPTDAELEKTLDDFERVAFAGLTPDQYTWCAVLHEEKDGSKHIHIIVPRVELISGKSMNIAPPGWQKAFYALRDALNFEHGWARPDDPRLARVVQPGAVASFASWKAGTDPRQQITDWLTAQVAAGLVNTRADVLTALKTLGQINRIGKDYISIRAEDGAKPIRLKGILFDEQLDGAAIRANSTAVKSRPAGRERPDDRAAEEARSRLAAIVRRRAQYNESRYAAPKRRYAASQRRNDGATPHEHPQSALHGGVAAHLDPRDRLSGDSRRRSSKLVEATASGLGSRGKTGTDTAADSGVLRESSGQKGVQTGVDDDDYRSEYDEYGYDYGSVPVASVDEIRDFGSIQSIDAVFALPSSPVDARGERAQRVLPSNERVDVEHVVTSRNNRLRRPRNEAAEVEDDRTRAAADGTTAQVERAARTALHAIEQCARAADVTVAYVERAAVSAHHSVVAACRVIDSADTAIKQCARAADVAVAHVERAALHAAEQFGQEIDATIVRLSAKMDTEISRFKVDISLSDYAQAEGYQLVKRESTKSSKVLKRGAETIIVTRQADGHDVYFSTGDDSDSGSIIDFVQRRNAVNLGQVRKMLRDWLPGCAKPAQKRPVREPARPVVTSKDRVEVLRRWSKLKPYVGVYLAQRHIDARIVAAFDVRQDERGNACFAHRDVTGVTGWESKNAGFTGFSAGGQRIASVTRLAGEDVLVTRLVITESAIDAMSYAQIKHEPGTAYISTGGSGLSEAQRDHLVQIMGGVSVVVLAMDKDDAGEKMAREIAQLAPTGVLVLRDAPSEGKDWNEALRLEAERPTHVFEIDGIEITLTQLTETSWRLTSPEGYPRAIEAAIHEVYAMYGVTLISHGTSINVVDYCEQQASDKQRSGPSPSPR